MELNKIKKYKGKMIRLTYGNGSDNKVAGKITAATSSYVLFIPNGLNTELPIKNIKIKEIELLDTYSHYIRQIKRYLKENKAQTALDICDKIIKIFKIPEQTKEIETYRTESLKILWESYNQIQ